jgi:ankyrin repeat protein
MLFRSPNAAAVGAALVVLCAAGCDDLFLSKETRQRIETIKARVSRDPSRIDAPDEEGEPPLHSAVIDGYYSLQVWLLERRANPNVRDSRGKTALQLAALCDGSKNRRTIRALIRAGASVNVVGEDGYTPLHTAAAFGTEASVRALLEGGADPRTVSQRGDTALHGASTPQPTRTPEDCRRIIAELVAHGALPDAGAHVDLEGPDRYTALSLAAVSGHAHAVALLLSRGADPSHRDEAGRTPLEAALTRPAILYTANGSGPVNVDAVVAILRGPARSPGAVR